MNRLKMTAALSCSLLLPLFSGCASYSAYQKGQQQELAKNWDDAVEQYTKALSVDPGNARFRIGLERARRQASQAHFEKGKQYRDAAATSKGAEQVRLNELAATELELATRLDTTNQYAAVELAKAVSAVEEAQRSQNAADKKAYDDSRKRARAASGKAQPPQLNPASSEPISLSFPRETPIKDIYKALGSAFGINILFDQAVKDDRVSIELHDVTAQQALERLMQAGGHFYKVLDERTIIVIPDNPQQRRDYEDLVIQTFYLSNGDAEQVTNVVRTMLEARNVFPLKALNAITIRDTADKVRIAEKIIEANDKARAEVVVDVDLLQLDMGRIRDLGAQFNATIGQSTTNVDSTGNPLPFTLDAIRHLTSKDFNFTVPNITYNFLKTQTNAEQLANPQLRISEGEKATLHIGSRIPVPVSTFQSLGSTTTGSGFSPVTSFQYQDVGIKVSIEPRVHHNREVTLKLTVEVSAQAGSVTVPGSAPQPIISDRTIESTIRLKDGETNFLAGLIQTSDTQSAETTPFLGDIPVIGRLFNHDHHERSRTDLILTMTPHIVRIPDITDDDRSPMWVGTSNNLTFRGVSPRIESRSGGDPFVNSVPMSQSDQFREPSAGAAPPPPSGSIVVPQGSAPTNVFANPTTPSNNTQMPTPNAPQMPPPTQPQVLVPSQPQGGTSNQSAGIVGSGPNNPFKSTATVSATIEPTAAIQTASLLAIKSETDSPPSVDSSASLRYSTRLAAQPMTMLLKPGEERVWTILGMDIDNLSLPELVLHYNPATVDVWDVAFGSALDFDPKNPPVVTNDRRSGTIRISSTDGKGLSLHGGGEIALLRVRGGMPGETFLVVEAAGLRNARGEAVPAVISGGRARVE
jgi:general secretion pathway protein D